MVEIITEVQVRDGRRQNGTVFLEMDKDVSPVEDVKFISSGNCAYSKYGLTSNDCFPTRKAIIPLLFIIQESHGVSSTVNISILIIPHGIVF